MNNFLANINIRPTSSIFSKCSINIGSRSLPHPFHPPQPAQLLPHSYVVAIFSAFSSTWNRGPFYQQSSQGMAPHPSNCMAGHHRWLCGSHPSTWTEWTKGSFVRHSFSGVWDIGTSQDNISIRKHPRKLTLYLIQSFENSMQTTLRENRGPLRTWCRRRRGTSTASSAKLRGNSQATCMADNGGDTSAANSHLHLLQPEGTSAALGLPPEDQDLLLDGNGVQRVVFLPLGIDAARVPALGLCNLGGEPVRVSGDAAGGAGICRWWDREGTWTKDASPAALHAPARRWFWVTLCCSTGCGSDSLDSYTALWQVLNSLSLSFLSFEMRILISLSHGLVENIQWYRCIGSGTL